MEKKQKKKKKTQTPAKINIGLGIPFNMTAQAEECISKCFIIQNNSSKKLCFLWQMNNGGCLPATDMFVRYLRIQCGQNVYTRIDIQTNFFTTA